MSQEGLEEPNSNDLPEEPNSNDVPEEPNSNEGLAEKIGLLRGTYAEVLDATKHQDDKIGRLLTAIAFLTAAALALSNLGGGRYLRAEFDLGGPSYRLGMLALAAFLISVSVSAVLLVTSFATPLRLPGLRSAETHVAPGIDWVNDIPGSQIYFSEISRLSLEEWRTKWSGSKKDLKEELAQSLVGETHNLSVRTNFKYDRTSEAIGVFAMAMLAFVLAVTFVTLALTKSGSSESDETILLGTGFEFRFWVSSVTAGYIAIHLYSRIRYTFQAKHEGWRRGKGFPSLFFSIGQVAVLASLSLYIWLVLHTAPGGRLSVRWLLIVGALWVFALVTSEWCQPGNTRKNLVRIWRVAVRSLAGAVALVGAGIVTGHTTYVCQFWWGMSASFGAIAFSILRPTWADVLSRMRK